MPFEKGKSGNPGGRRKEKNFTKSLAAALEANDKFMLNKLRDVLIEEALAKQSWAMKELLDRYEGKVPQGIIGGEEDDNPLNVAVTRIRNIIVDPKDPDDGA